ncbi:hypothetical protein ACFSGX_06650 [Sphingomonas arantia]|uniref:SH3 domain-containing protein n=1 Tax=Sphingomonas arantia TaxID=1460676 RepID=A0ABW4TUR9_9SPHN
MMGLMLVLAAAAVPASAARCAIDGWSSDTDPTGLRVRAGPASGAREIGRLPPAIRGDDRYAPSFHIVDMQDGWVNIAGADDLDAPTPRPVFGGTGWVHGSRVTFTVQATVGRAAARVGAPVVVALDTDLGDAGERTQPILACSGGWGRLRYRVPEGAKATIGARTGKAWFGAVCGNQHTSCDSLVEADSVPGR